ncbi:copper resistance CopC/CopD family protein [Cryobacterium sp. 5B3]|uniref:copper resistance CopC/CopD family protein n=1 Tax=Cryobacterium sp. 5B3 TaxID=3048586 RepID=UPI002AB5450A|nr:copper resistance protein CopC [Cryobacterium sp. 5B3]MDY7542387.1 copper resistance protein CopC [Cryobacterium sp. 5B3]MEB0276712.1 copper resistance protein CopC [Cryobacterium sp. 5B3]
MTSSWLRIRSRAAAILVAALVLVLFGASPAWAHSGLERSDPPNGGVISVGRSTLTLWFTEAIAADASAFELRTADGVRVAVTASVSGADDGGIVRIHTQPLEKATYLLDWKVLATDDGHTSNGSVYFGVGTRPTGVAAAAGVLPDTPGLLIRWIDLSAIILCIGAIAVSGRVLGSTGSTGSSGSTGETGLAPRRRAWFIGALAAGVAVVTGALTPFLLTQPGGGSLGDWFDATWATLTGTPWGYLWSGREIALVIAAGTLYRAAHSPRAGGQLRVAVVALVAVVGLESWAGHASTLPRGSALAVLAAASHLVAAGIWAGGLAVLALCLIPLLRRHREARKTILASAWRSFSPMAAIATVVLVATGLYEAGLHVPDLSFVASTVYGTVVAGKLVLVAVALVLGGINTLLVNPRLAARVGRILGRPGGWAPVPVRRFALVVGAEVLILVLAVGAAGLLTSIPTAREIASATKETTLHTATVDGLFVTLEHVAAGPDRSRLIVRARSIVKLEAEPVSDITVTLAGPTGTTGDVILERIEPGRFEAETAQPTPGDWSATVALDRDGLPTAVTRVDWTVAEASPADARPLEVVTSVLAILLLGAMLGAVFFARRRGPAAAALPLHPVRVSENSGSQR